MGDLLQEVDKRTIEDMLKDALNSDPRISDADILRKLDMLRSKTPFPLPDDDNLNLPLLPRGDDDDNRTIPPVPSSPSPLQSLHFQPPQ